MIKTVSLPSAIEDTLYQTRVYASDQDSALFGDVVHYRLLKPAWLVIDSTAGVISGTPHVQNVFDTVAVLQAYDNHGATDSATIYHPCYTGKSSAGNSFISGVDCA